MQDGSSLNSHVFFPKQKHFNILTGRFMQLEPDRLRLIFGRLNVSTSARDMNLPGVDLHELRGSRRGMWAVKVSGNWRVTFTWAGKDVDRVDYEDH
jgi:plasmid maintenance system killer protein